MPFTVRTSLLENMDEIPQLPPVAEFPEGLGFSRCKAEGFAAICEKERNYNQYT
jgi:hypothetical protein